MDKLKNGSPINPRDGATVEITGLLYSTLVFLDNLNKEEKYPYLSVSLSNDEELTFFEWKNRLKYSFEKLF